MNRNHSQLQAQQIAAATLALALAVVAPVAVASGTSSCSSSSSVLGAYDLLWWGNPKKRTTMDTFGKALLISAHVGGWATAVL